MILSATNAATTADTANAKATAANDPAASQDRFLKLLVAQLNNQDPMNPLDNAQMTSQIAQINTVTGIATLNDTVKSLSSQFMQSQALQGASLVGRSVLTEGKALHFNADGTATGGFELANAADSVKVEVVSAAGRVVDTVDVGAASAGRTGFE